MAVRDFVNNVNDNILRYFDARWHRSLRDISTGFKTFIRNHAALIWHLLYVIYLLENNDIVLACGYSRYLWLWIHECCLHCFVILSRRKIINLVCPNKLDVSLYLAIWIHFLANVLSRLMKNQNIVCLLSCFPEVHVIHLTFIINILQILHYTKILYQITTPILLYCLPLCHSEIVCS